MGFLRSKWTARFNPTCAKTPKLDELLLMEAEDKGRAQIIFVLPLRNPGTARDWPRCVELCRQTLRSIANQTADSSSYRVILAGEEFGVVNGKI
jgi:hypothetical protein